MEKSLIQELFRKQRDGIETNFFIPKSVMFHACFKPFENLKRVSIGELMKEVPAKGSYLLVRIIDYPIQYSGVMLLVEDHSGQVAVCFLYDHLLKNATDKSLQVGTVFILKEPCLTASTGVNSVLVVGSPSDFVKIGRSHVLFKEMDDLGWVDGTTSNKPRTAEEWRLVGNSYFKSADYDEAIQAYLVALALCKDRNTKLVMHLNLAASYLTTGYYERTLKHTSEVLEIQPENEKALFRTARAYYELRNFVEAEQILRRLVQLHPANKNAYLELSRCKERLQDCRVGVNVHELYSTCAKNPCVSINFGLYIGDLEVVPISGKGRGVIAKQDIRCGTLILAEKALVANLTDDSSFGIGAGVLTKLLVQALSKNPLAVGEVVFQMTSNNQNWDRKKAVVCDDGQPVIEYDRLLQIVNMNSFSLISESEGVTPMSSKRALFPYASYFNHSCTCNSTFEIFNDVIIIRSLTDISAGEEITISYISNLATFAKRESLLCSYGFSCKCIICEIDRGELPDIRYERDSLMAEVKSLYISSTCLQMENGTNAIVESKLSDVITKLEQSYLLRKEYRVHLFRSYLLLAQAVERHGPEFRCEFFKTIDSGLQCVGLSIQSLFESANNVLVSLPKNALVCKLLFQYASVCARAELSYNLPDQINRWVKVLLMLERLFTGGDKRLLRERFKDSLLMSLVIENASV